MKPTVLTLDTRDDRRELLTLLLRGLPPRRAVDFLDWALALARLTRPGERLLDKATADRAKMAAMLLRAEADDDAARLALANEVYRDLAALCHHFGLDLLAVGVELERWAKGRGVTPPVAAAAAVLRRRSPPSSAAPPRTGGSTGSAPSGRSCPR